MIIEFTSDLGFLSNQKASIICKSFKISTEAEKILLNADLSSLDFLKLLVQAKAYKDIINFIEFSISLPASLTWSYECLITLPNIEEEALGLDTLISNWIKEPTDEIREDIRQKSETINYANPWGFLGMAVYWSGGNISPKGKPEVFIPEQAIRSLIANSIIFAALGGDATLIEQRFLDFVEKGLLILSKINKEQA